MSILMGGSGSTGSSLVKNILNRSEDLFAGGEMAFFSKKELYTNWEKYSKRIGKRGLSGLRNFGFHLYNGSDLDYSEYLNSSSDIAKMIKKSKDIIEFSELFFSKALHLNTAKIWLEKTPANAACFFYFLNATESGKVIHMMRNPYDTIASLVGRGFDPYYATGIYLLNTSAGLSVEGFSDRYHEIKYEDVISSASRTIQQACSFLDIRYHDDMLISQGEKIKNSQLKGWNHDETGNIGNASIGRFAQLNEEDQSIIIEAVNKIRVSPRGLDYYGISITSIEEICDKLDYSFYPTANSTYYSKLKSFMKKDRFARIRRGYPTGVFYPLVLIK